MAERETQREFQFTGVFNFRDVGGYPAADGRTVRWRRLFRSDTLSGLVDSDRPQFLSLGIRTVLDLRRPAELTAQGRVPEWDGLRHRHLPPEHLEWHHNPYQDGQDPSRYLADRYHDLAEQGAPQLAEAVSLIADDTAAPLVVHCVAGKDRTGVVCALTLALLGVSDHDIDTDYTRSSLGNERYVNWARANGRSDLRMLPWFYSPPGTMRTFLSELRQRHGSVEDYLGRAGLAGRQMAALRRHLLD